MCEVRGKMLVHLAVSLIFLGLVEGFPTKKTQNNPLVRVGTLVEAQAQAPSIDALQDLEVMQEHNQVRSIPSGPLQHKKRWSQHLPKPQPEEEMKPFVLDLKNFPSLANVDLSSQNPNIQVTIEVIDDPQADIEMDLDEEGHRDWGTSSVDLPGNKKLFWPLFWGYPDSEEDTNRPSLGDTAEDDGSEELVLSGSDWDSRWRKGWDAKEHYEDEEEDEWSTWSPCSVSCGQGNQKRTRSCGYACTATESRTCDLERCPGDVNAVTELIPYEAENSTEILGAELDSCEKWLNCKSDFLQKYLGQVQTELPSCPCSYPSEVVYGAVSIFDERLRRAHRWRDASGPRERLEVYRPTARACLRSMLSADSGTLAAQLCCYDGSMRLLTRGKGAGAPDLVSVDFSPELHFKVDVLPWVLCKGDWSRFHAARPPNNGLRCAENPRAEVFANELEEAREY